MQKICGFVVVRKPEFASSDLVKPNLRIDGKTYHGIDRLRWEDLDLAYYDRRLPAALVSIWRELDRDTNDFSGVKLLKSYEKAEEVLHFSGDKSEIIAIWSAELAKLKGAMNSDLAWEFLGIDCFSLGEWSVLRDGVFLRPEHFVEAVTQLNPWGLLNSEAQCKEVFDRYLDLSSTETVEPLMENPSMTSISVFRVTRR